MSRSPRRRPITASPDAKLAPAAAAPAARADIHADRVLIVDFGSQYTQLIARRVRELGVYCEIHPWDMSDAAVRAFGARGVILSGGPESVTVAGAPAAPRAVFELGVPVLGICYGMHTMAAQLGGRVVPGGVSEFGYAEVRARGHSALLRDIEDRVNAEGHGLLDVWMSHGDRVADAAARFPGDCVDQRCSHQRHGRRAAAPLCAAVPSRGHAHAARARASTSASCTTSAAAPTPGPPATSSRMPSRACAPRSARGACCSALSGGVDSSVVAALLHKAIGAQLSCVFVDHGLLRLREGDAVMDVFAKNLGVRVIRVDAGERFFAALRGVDDPEAKRKIIGCAVHRDLRGAGRAARRRGIPGAGHDLSGRDRIGRRRAARRT